jgi:Glycosyl hydrolases family 16
VVASNQKPDADVPRLNILPRRTRRLKWVSGRLLALIGLPLAFIAGAALGVSMGSLTTGNRQTVTTTTPVQSTTTGPRTTTRPAVVQPAGIAGHWHLVLDSEFNGSSLPKPWRSGWFGAGVTGPVNSAEADCYSPAALSYSRTGLNIRLTQTSATCSGKTEPWTTGLITTNPDDGRPRGTGFQYTYGVIQARIDVQGSGANQLYDWPAFWADGQNWPQSGEDDVLEGLVGDACFHFHSPSVEQGGCEATITPGWHTFASDWKPGSVTYYYDGAKVGSITSGITSAPMYLILDNAANSSGAVADSMKVQYVRVWQSA